MELIYSVMRRPPSGRESGKDEDIVCCLSSKNIVAFSSCSSLDHDGSKDESTNYVYVCDINKPWQHYAVDSFTHKVTSLEWHTSGFQLLILTENGCCAVYEMQDYLLNTWKCKHKTEANGERYITAAWFSQAHKVVLIGDKREAVSYTEKISRDRCSPTLQQYGGRAVDGWVAVTASNIVAIGIPKPDNDVINIECACLSAARGKITVADIHFDSTNGDILIVTSNGHVTSAVTSYRISVQSESDLYKPIVKSMSSLYAKCQPEPRGDLAISHVRFMGTETGYGIVVAVGNSKGSQVELWTLSKAPLPLHQSFTPSHPDTKISRTRWTNQGAVSHASMPVSVALPTFPVQYSTLDPTGKLFQCLAVAYKDGSIKIVSKPSFQAVTTTNLDMGFNDVDRPGKRSKLLPCIISMQQTFTGCGLVGFDQFGCMYMMKVVNTRDPVTEVKPHYLVAMLEYLTMSGHDCWDVLIALKPGIIENVIQRFVDNFAKQANVIQELLYPRHMAIRAALYRCSSAAQQRSADCHCRLLVHLISTHFRSLLQPKGLSTQDLGPVEKLALNCNSKKAEPDIDKVMMALNPEKKEFVVEERTLQAMQPHIQWIGDLTMYLLTSLPTVQGYASSFPGYSLLYDTAVLSTLREVLVMIRIWNIVHQRPLLHFTATTPNLDPLLEMFKLLTKVWQQAKDGKGMDFDEALIDKCCLLQSQVYTPTVNQLLLGNTNYASSLLLQNHPLKYEYGEIPDHVTNAASLVTPDRQMSKHCVDIVHMTNLGLLPADRTQSCVRCECMSTLESSTNVPALKSWEGKWLRHCLCGGLWKQDDLPTMFSLQPYRRGTP